MNIELLYGQIVGGFAFLACLLVGLILVALRTKGRVRLYAVSGFGLLLGSRAVGIILNFIPLPFYASRSIYAGGLLLTNLLVLIGLLSLGMAFLPGPHRAQAKS